MIKIEGVNDMNKIILVVLAMFLVLSVSAYASLNDWYGTVTYLGSPADDGISIDVYNFATDEFLESTTYGQTEFGIKSSYYFRILSCSY